MRPRASLKISSMRANQLDILRHVRALPPPTVTRAPDSHVPTADGLDAAGDGFDGGYFAALDLGDAALGHDHLDDAVADVPPSGKVSHCPSSAYKSSRRGSAADTRIRPVLRVLRASTGTDRGAV